MRVSGVVRDSRSGKAVAGANVELNVAGRALAALVSNRVGEFELSDDVLRVGQMLFCRVEKQGYATKETTIRLETGDSRLDLELEPQALIGNSSDRRSGASHWKRWVAGVVGGAIAAVVAGLIVDWIRDDGGEGPPPPTVRRFAIVPEKVSRGQDTTVGWDVSDAVEVEIDPQLGAVALSGCRQIAPENSTTYTLIATNQLGVTATAQATVFVETNTEASESPPRIVFFRASKAKIHSGQTTRLSWEATDAESVSIAGIGRVAPSGNLSVSPRRTVTYRLVAEGRGESDTRSVTVEVEPVPSRNEWLKISSMAPRPPATISVASRKPVRLKLDYSVNQSSTLEIIPLDRRKARVPGLAWQAAGPRVWSGRVGPMQMTGVNGAGAIDFEFKLPSGRATVATIRCRILRSGARRLISSRDFPAQYSFR